MSIEGLDLGEWVTRLENQVGELRDVGLAEGVPSAWETLRVAPSAFVVPVREQPASPGGASDYRVVQLVEQRVGVLVAVSNRRDSRGGAVQDTLRTLLAQLRPALLGWRPTNAVNAVTYGGGRIMRYDERALWWQELFDTSYRLTFGANT